MKTVSKFEGLFTYFMSITYISNGYQCIIPLIEFDILVQYFPTKLWQTGYCCCCVTSPAPREAEATRGTPPIANSHPVTCRVMRVWELEDPYRPQKAEGGRRGIP